MHSIQLAIKRFFDILLCLIVSVIASPLFLILAIAVRFSSPGPILFIQERVGKNRKSFSAYKFRTMQEYTGAQPAIWTQNDENRVTPVGHFLRDYGLDELPQVINILRGDMSIIGPRPPLPAQAEEFTEKQQRMFLMRPGVLSLAAVEGRRSISPERRIELHVEYVDRWSLWLDIRILWRSLFVVLRRQNVTEQIR